MSSTLAEAASSNDNQLVSGWRGIGRIIIKGVILFMALNLIFAACRPLNTLGSASLYNSIFPGRLRLPYGEVPADDYNLTLNNIPAMFASHLWSRAGDDEFRVLLIGDSATWGWFLENKDTLSGQLNALNLVANDGRPVVVYNLGYPVMSLTKDLLILDKALQLANPDLIIWPVTMQSFDRPRQLEHPLLNENADVVRDLIDRYGLALDTNDARLVDRSFWQETIFWRRRETADLIRLQGWGMAWAASGHDQSIPDEIPLRKSDFDADESWLGIAVNRPLTGDDLSFDVLSAGVARAGEIPLIVVNEPMFISQGENSDIRYNAFYPRWAYDQYRVRLKEVATTAGWNYLDLWDAIPAEEFTDTPVHLTPAGNRMLAGILQKYLTDANFFAGNMER